MVVRVDLPQFPDLFLGRGQRRLQVRDPRAHHDLRVRELVNLPLLRLHHRIGRHRHTLLLFIRHAGLHCRPPPLCPGPGRAPRPPSSRAPVRCPHPPPAPPAAPSPEPPPSPAPAHSRCL